MKICLCRQVFVRAQTSGSHLAWSAVDRKLKFFGDQDKLDPILSQVRVNKVFKTRRGVIKYLSGANWPNKTPAVDDSP